jgi:hypothetical protein
MARARSLITSHATLPPRRPTSRALRIHAEVRREHLMGEVCAGAGRVKERGGVSHDLFALRRILVSDDGRNDALPVLRRGALRGRAQGARSGGVRGGAHGLHGAVKVQARHLVRDGGVIPSSFKSATLMGR